MARQTPPSRRPQEADGQGTHKSWYSSPRKPVQRAVRAGSPVLYARGYAVARLASESARRKPVARKQFHTAPTPGRASWRTRPLPALIVCRAPPALREARLLVRLATP